MTITNVAAAVAAPGMVMIPSMAVTVVMAAAIVIIRCGRTHERGGRNVGKRI